MNREALLATVVTALVVTVYQFRQIETPAAQATARSAPAAPVVEAAPSLQLAPPGRSAMASMEIWNLKPLSPLTAGNLPSLKDMFKPYYTMSNGRFDSIERSDRPNEQWQFQGVVASQGALRALFYNPGLKRLKNVGKGESLDDGLQVRAVDAKSVTVETKGEKKPSRFELRLFTGKKESHVANPKSASQPFNQFLPGGNGGVRRNDTGAAVLQGRVRNNAQPAAGRTGRAPGRSF